MRNLLAFVALAFIGFAAIGWFRGWYSFQSTQTANGGRNINIDVNSQKISQDLKTSKDKLRGLLTEKKDPQTTPPQLPPYPEAHPAVFRTPDGTEIILPSVPGTIDLSDDGWWPSSPRK